MWTFRWIDELAQDLRYTSRMIRKTPVLAAVVVSSLAVAIGANTAVFSIVDATLLKLLPVRNPGELVLFGWNCGPKSAAHSVSGSLKIDPRTGLTESTSFSALQFERMSGENQTLTDLFAYASLGEVNMAADGRSDIASGQIVSGGYFKGLGVQAVMGRVLTIDDDQLAAIGADAQRVLIQVMRETMLLVLIGVALGAGGSLAITRLVASMLFGLTPNDPLTITLSALTLVSVAAVSGYLPARRASRIEPIRALRYE